MRTLANECVRRGEGWHIRVLSTDSNQLTLIFSNRKTIARRWNSGEQTIPTRYGTVIEELIRRSSALETPPNLAHATSDSSSRLSMRRNGERCKFASEPCAFRTFRVRNFHWELLLLNLARTFLSLDSGAGRKLD